MNYRFAIPASLATLAILLAAMTPDAHVTIRSPYTYNKDVAPIVKRRCADCHFSGGISWIPLDTYDELRTLSWPLRQSLISGRMPPWFGESGVATLREPTHALTARELDILMTWAAGGAPEGPAVSLPATPSSAQRTPDIVLEMPEPFVSETSSADAEIRLPTAAVKGKWIRSFDLQAGTPAIVHHATLLTRRGGLEQAIGTWIPGEPSLALADNGAFFIASDAELLLIMHYQRPSAQGLSVDKSRVAIYFADSSAAREVESLDLGQQPSTLDHSVRAVALQPIDGPAGARLTVRVIAANRSSSVLARVQIRPEWPHRYVFVQPVLLEKGSRIEMAAEPWDSSIWQSLTGDVRRTEPVRPLHAVLEVLR